MEQPGARGGGEGQRDKIQNRQKGDKRFEDEGGAGVQHRQKGSRLYSGGIQVGGV